MKTQYENAFHAPSTIYNRSEKVTLTPKILSDLYIFETLDPYPSDSINGSFERAHIDNERYATKRQYFIILFNKNALEDISAISHELEHYDIAKTLIKLQIIKEEEYTTEIHKPNGELVLIRANIPEWAHSNPSYYPEPKEKASA
jgi:hypothetical protein